MHSSRMRTSRSLTVCCSFLQGRVSAWSRGGSPWRGGGVCLVLGGFSLPGGSAWSRGVRGVLPARGACPETPLPPVNRITDTCKNITLSTTSLRPVIILSERKYLESNAHLIETKTNRQQTQNKIFLRV